MPSGFSFALFCLTIMACGFVLILVVLDALPKKHQAEARTLLCAMPYAETQAACEALRVEFTSRYRKLAPKAVERLADDWDRLVTFYQFPREHWPHIRVITYLTN